MLFFKTILFFLSFFIILNPYIVLTYEYSGGDIRSFGENQLKNIYDGLLTEVAPYLESHVEDNEIILMPIYYPLQNFLHRNVRVIALNKYANLGALRDLIENNNSDTIMSSLYELNVSYFLEYKVKTPFEKNLYKSSILFNVVRNPRYSKLISFRHWNLYELIEGRESAIIGYEDNLFIK